MNHEPFMDSEFLRDIALRALDALEGQSFNLRDDLVDESSDLSIVSSDDDTIEWIQYESSGPFRGSFEATVTVGFSADRATFSGMPEDERRDYEVHLEEGHYVHLAKEVEVIVTVEVPNLECIPEDPSWVSVRQR